MWLLRAVAMIVLWIGWLLGRQGLDSQAIPAFMLGFGAIIAFTRSASSHASDAGEPKASRANGLAPFYSDLILGRRTLNPYYYCSPDSNQTSQ